MTPKRRIEALEAKAGDDAPIAWGAGFEDLPPMTMTSFRNLVKVMHETDAGRLPIVKQYVRPVRQ